MENLRRRLIEKQQAEGLNDDQFACLLGVSRVTWNRVKNGKPIGPNVLAGVARQFPTLTDEVLTTLAQRKREVA